MGNRDGEETCFPFPILDSRFPIPGYLSVARRRFAFSAASLAG